MILLLLQWCRILSLLNSGCLHKIFDVQVSFHARLEAIRDVQDQKQEGHFLRMGDRLFLSSFFILFVPQLSSSP